MAVVLYQNIESLDHQKIISWLLTGGDTGQPFACSNLADKTVQIFGTIGAAISIQGSSDPRVDYDPTNAQWETLTDNTGTAISYSTHALKLIAECPKYIRPSAAAGTTSATIILVCNQG